MHTPMKAMLCGQDFSHTLRLFDTGFVWFSELRQQLNTYTVTCECQQSQELLKRQKVTIQLLNM